MAMSKTSTKLWSHDFYDAVDPKLTTIGLHTKEKPDWIKPETMLLPDFDLWYISAGRGEVRVNDQWHEFETGDLITLKPGDLYQCERTGKPPHQSIFMHLLPFGTKQHPFNQPLADVWPVKMSLIHRQEIAELFSNIFDAYVTQSKGGSLLIRGMALQLLYVIFDELHRTPPQQRPRAYQNLLRATLFIEKNYAKPIKLADIIEYSGLGSSQLSALFKRQTGYSPIEYLIHIRIREAKRLLAHGERVKEVAYAAGFESENYFSQMVKKKVGIPPTAFARKHKRPASRTKN